MRASRIEVPQRDSLPSVGFTATQVLYDCFAHHLGPSVRRIRLKPGSFRYRDLWRGSVYSCRRTVDETGTVELGHDLEEVVVGIDVSAFDTADALHWAVLASTTDRYGFNFALSLHEFGEDCAGAGAGAVLKEKDVVCGEGLFGSDVGEVTVARDADVLGLKPVG